MMTQKEKDDFAEANKTIHPVETQWHYPTMTKYGYIADTQQGIGFVRTYDYHHPTSGHSMSVTTGYSADYFRDDHNPMTGLGFWGDLEPHLKKITGTTLSK